MKYLKIFVPTIVVAIGLVVSAASASATTLEVGGVTQNSAVALVASLQPGTSLIIRDEFGTTTDTCSTFAIEATMSEDTNIEGTTTSGFSGVELNGTVSNLTMKNCSHTTTVTANGELRVKWTSGTNGTVRSNGAEVTVQSTFFGASAVCRTGAGTKLGTLTGVGSGNATIDISANVNCGILGTSTWTGTYIVASPKGLGVVS